MAQARVRLLGRAPRHVAFSVASLTFVGMVVWSVALQTTAKMSTWVPLFPMSPPKTSNGDVAADATVEPVGTRRVLLALPGLALAAGSEDAHAAGQWSTDKFDGSYTDEKIMCADCTRTISCEGGFGQVRGRDTREGELWNGFVEYTDKSIKINIVYDEDNTKSMKGTWFSKKGEKGIKWDDGSVWNKMEYKEIMSPYEVDIKLASEYRALTRKN